MSFRNFFKSKPDPLMDRNDIDSGILIFDSTSEVIRAENELIDYSSISLMMSSSLY